MRGIRGLGHKGCEAQGDGGTSGLGHKRNWDTETRLPATKDLTI